jgi:uncharacterized protein with HEPN domain
VPHERWENRVQDILIAIQRIQRYTAGLSFEAFSKDEKTVDAVVRNLSIIGEAARHIPSDVQARSPASLGQRCAACATASSTNI